MTGSNQHSSQVGQIGWAPDYQKNVDALREFMGEWRLSPSPFGVRARNLDIDLALRRLKQLEEEHGRLVEQLEAALTFSDHFLQWCETVAAEEDSPIHLLVAEAQALNPARSPDA